MCYRSRASTSRTCFPTITRSPIVAAAAGRAALKGVTVDSLGLDRISSGSDHAIAAVNACHKTSHTSTAVVGASSFLETKAIVWLEGFAVE